MYLIAMPLLVYGLTESALQMGVMYFFETIPILIISIFSGVLVDRYEKKRIMIISNVAQTILVFLIAALYHFNYINIFYLYLIGFLLSLSGVFFSVANESIIPSIIEKEKIIKFNSTFELYKTFASLIGPLLGGIVISTSSNPVNALIFTGFSFFPVTIIIFFLKEKHTLISPIKNSIIKNAQEGLTFVLKNRILLQLLIITLILNLIHGSISAMFIFFCKEELNLNSFYIGLIVSISAGFQILASLGIPYIYKRIKSFRILTDLQALSAVGIVLMSLSKTSILLVVGKSITEVPVIFFNIVNRTLRQEITPLEILGRVNGINRMISMASVPIAGLASGIATQYIRVSNLFLLLGVLLFIISLSFSLLIKMNIFKMEKES